MKLGFTKNQVFKVLKAALYIGASAIISYLVTLTTDQPELFGQYTAVINLVLVILKQFVTEDK